MSSMNISILISIAFDILLQSPAQTVQLESLQLVANVTTDAINARGSLIDAHL